MKDGGFAAGLLLLLLTGFPALAQEPWNLDAERGEGYHRAGDHNAAWLFYERALRGGCDDGIQIFLAAESFRRQDLTEDPELSAHLYAVARYFLSTQYPENPALDAAGTFIPPDIEVNRRFIRRFYTRIGGRPPRIPYPAAEEIAGLRDFLSDHFMELRGLYAAARSEGIPAAIAFVRSRFPRILLSWLLFSLPTGLFLPVVMARAVSLEGRKSYVTAYAFLLHWGVLGIHRFYLGRVTSGVIWLISGGLFGIGVFFDIFLTGAYVRFWNEDHRNLRPVSGGRPPTARRKRPAPKARPAAPVSRKSKRTEPPRRRKSSPAGSASPSRRPPSPQKAAPSPPPEDDFTFSDPALPAAGTAAAAAGAVAGAAAASAADTPEFSDDFGDIPGLDELDDTNFTESPSPEAPSRGDFSEDNTIELQDDDFNIELPE